MREKKLILIIDDNPYIIKLIGMYLEKAGFEVITAEDGVQGLARSQEDDPDLIITDIMMPNLDGIELCEKIRSDSRNPMVPLIFLTAVDSEISMQRGFRAGADQYLVKAGINTEVLLAMVKKLLGRSERIKEIDVNANAGFSGNFQDLTLTELIQLLHLNQKTGILEIKREPYPDSTVYFDSGEVIHARIGNDEHDEKALSTLSNWKKGDFYFRHKIVDTVKKTISSKTRELIVGNYGNA